MARVSWADLPTHVRRSLEVAAGAPVVEVRAVEGGFSPCLAAAAELADGRAVFLKAVSSRQNPESPAFLRRELDLIASLPPHVPAPRLLATLPPGEWVGGVFELVDGRPPPLPWDEPHLDAALRALRAIGGLPAPADLPPARTRLGPLFDGWTQLTRAGVPVDDRWAARHVAELVELERAALDALAGDRLVHADVRADNLLVDGDGRVVVVDWAHACAGPPWLDLVLWLPALELEGGGAPEEVLARWCVETPPPADAVTAVVAAFAGYLVHRGGLPDPPGLPTLRAFQRAQAGPALRWLRHRLGT